MTRRTKAQKKPIVVAAFLMLGGLVIASICAAKMIVNPLDKDGDSQIASWDVSVNSDNTEDIDVVANGDESTYSFVVKNDSDVASSYVITVSNIPAGVRVGLDTGDFQEENSEVTFTNNYELGVGASAPHTLKIKAALSAVAEANDIVIDVKFTQKRAGQ